MKKSICVFILLTLAASITSAAPRETSIEDFKKLLKIKGNRQGIHKIYSAQFFNETWKYISKTNRSEEDMELMLASAHASLIHWKKRTDLKPVNLSVSYWQLGRVYNLIGETGFARRWGDKCVELGLKNKLGPFYIGYGYEVLAHSYALEKKHEKSKLNLKKAEAQLKKVQNKVEKKYLSDDLKAIRAILK